MKTITKREKLIYIAFIALLLAILLLAIISDVYARYASSISGSGEIELAKWLCKVNDAREGENFAIDIKTTDDIETKILPGTTGTFKIIIENASDVPAQYTIELEEKFMNTEISTDVLKVYTDDTYQTMIDIENNNLQGKLNGGETKVITFYWKWVSNEARDQIIAENYDGFTISATVTNEQTTISKDENIEMTIQNK